MLSKHHGPDIMGGIHLSQLHPVCVQPGHLCLVNLHLNSCALVAFRVLFSVFERSYVCIERMTLAIFELANRLTLRSHQISPFDSRGQKTKAHQAHRRAISPGRPTATSSPPPRWPSTRAPLRCQCLMGIARKTGYIVTMLRGQELLGGRC